MGDSNPPAGHGLPDHHPHNCEHPHRTITEDTAALLINGTTIDEQTVKFCMNCQSIRDADDAVALTPVPEDAECDHPYETVSTEPVVVSVAEYTQNVGRVEYCANCNGVLDVEVQPSLEYTRF